MQTKNESKKPLLKISRFELIGDGREVVLYEDMEFTLQDNGRTLKVFRKPKTVIFHEN